MQPDLRLGSDPATDKALIAQIRRLPAGTRLARPPTPLTRSRKSARSPAARSRSCSPHARRHRHRPADPRRPLRSEGCRGHRPRRRAPRVPSARRRRRCRPRSRQRSARRCRGDDQAHRRPGAARALRERPSESDPQPASQSKLLSGLRKLSTLVSGRVTTDDDLEMDNLAPPEAPTSPEDLKLLRDRLEAALQTRVQARRRRLAGRAEPAAVRGGAGAAAATSAPNWIVGASESDGRSSSIRAGRAAARAAKPSRCSRASSTSKTAPASRDLQRPRRRPPAAEPFELRGRSAPSFVTPSTRIWRRSSSGTRRAARSKSS